METKLEIYNNRSFSLEKQNKKLEASINITNKNKILIKDFQNYISSTGSQALRITKLTSQLIKLAIILIIDFNRATRKDILEVVSQINQNKILSECTKADYRRCLKQFYKWFKEEDPRLDNSNLKVRREAQKFYNFLERDISINYKKKQIDPTSILFEEDINQVITCGCRSVKEKALIKFLHETGIRAGELLNLRIRDIEIKKNLGVAYVNGKTGRRAVQFSCSMPYIVQWLSLHPFREDKHCYIWLGEANNRKYEPLKHVGAQKLINRVFSRAGVDKKHNLHWFRHSRASILAPKLPEIILCKYMGWVIGSRQVATYCHLAPQQVENAFLKINGLEEEKKKTNLPLKCGCGEINDPFSHYCFKCGNPLKVEFALQDNEIIKNETEIAIKEMMQMFKNPELLKLFEEFRQKKLKP